MTKNRKARPSDVARASASARVIRLSEQVEAMRPEWVRFVVELGYTHKQGERFADGYAAALKKLPTLGKLRAIAQQDDGCMAAGFRAAGINEDEAFERAHE